MTPSQQARQSLKDEIAGDGPLTDDPAAAAPRDVAPSATRAEWIQAVAPAARRVAQELQVPVEAVIGQWGLETGWGRSVIPGTNNLGNIKDFSGSGVAATDNMTGSRDRYRQYASTDEFAGDFTQLLGNRRYAGARGATDAQAYFTGLKAGGYAEDPDYVAKGVQASRMAALDLGQQPAEAAPVAAGPLPPAWSTITAKPEWAALSGSQRAAAKAAYFDYYIAPRAGSDAAELREQFLAKVDADPHDGKAAFGVFPNAPQPRTEAPDARAASGSVLEGAAPAEALPTDSRFPWKPEVRAQFNATYDAATPEQRQAMTGQPGMVGMLARERAGIFERKDATGIAQLQAIDPRAEYRAARLTAGGDNAQFAARAAREGAARGVTPGREVAALGGTVENSTFDFDTAQAFAPGAESNGLNNPLTRGIAKGVLGVGKAGAGYMQFLAEVGGLDNSARMMAGAGDTLRGKEGAIGERGDFLARNLESAISSISQQLPLMVTGVAAGSQAIPLAGMAVQAFGQEFSDGRARGLNTTGATARAGLMAAFEVVGERFGLGEQMAALRAAARGMPDDAIADLLWSALRKEISGESLTTTGQFAVDKFTPVGLNPDATFGDYLAQMGDTITQTVMQGGIMQGGTRGVGAATRFMGERGAVSDGVADADAEAVRRQVLDRWSQFGAGMVRPAAPAPAAISPDGRIEPTIVSPLATEADGIVGELADMAGLDREMVLPNMAPVAPAAAPVAPAGGSVAQDTFSDADVASFAQARRRQLTSKRDGQLQTVPGDDGLIDVDVPGTPLSQTEQAELDQLDAGADPAALRAMYGIDDAADMQTQAPPAEPERWQIADLSDRPGEELREQARNTQDKRIRAAIREELQRRAPVEDTTGIRGAFDSLSDGGVTQDFFQQAFDALQAGSTRIAGVKDPVLARARAAFKAGLITSPDDIRRFEADGYPKAQPEEPAAHVPPTESPAGEAAQAPGAQAAPQVNPEPQGTIDVPQAVEAEQASQEGSPAPAAPDQLTAAANEAATSPTNDRPEPTAAQKEAGNYRKGHIKVDGLDLTIENPIGSTRSGTSPDGTTWSVDMTAHYGYAKRTEGADGDHVDVYVAPNAQAGAPVYVVDQFNADGTFDEHKAVMGVATEADALAIYDAHFSDGSGPRRRRGVASMTPDQFKAWAASDSAKKPVATKPRTEREAKQMRKPAAAPAKPRAMTHEGRAVDGGPLLPGDVFATASGRSTTPFPKQKGNRYHAQWLIDNAVAEAQARGDDFNATGFAAENPGKDGMLPPASGDAMNEYLFGQQPAVAPSVLRPLVPSAAAPAPAPAPAAEPAPKKKPRNQREAEAARAQALADYFTPGNVVKSYGGHDRVIAFTPAANGEPWSVTVRAVRPRGGKWEFFPDQPERTHATMPDARAMLRGPVELAPAPVQQDNAPQEATDAPNTTPDLERDRQEPGAVPGDARAVRGDARDAGRDDAQAPGPAGRGDGAGQRDDAGVSPGDAAVRGKRSDQRVHRGDAPTAAAQQLAGTDNADGVLGAGGAGVPAEPVATDKVAGVADRARAAAGKRSSDVAPRGIAEVRAALPQLLPQQQDDVAKAELTFAKPDGHGMLFTNGTGTGKTFTGLGVVKRSHDAGKSDILIVVPDEKMADDWIEAGKALDLSIEKLPDTTTAGKGVVLTTYAGLGLNNALASRAWDMVVADEAHMLMAAQDATPTLALRRLRAITMHPDGPWERQGMLHADELREITQLSVEAEAARGANKFADAERLEKQVTALRKKLDDGMDAIKAEFKAAAADGRRTKLLALSATPFAYEKNIEWAQGYLFDYHDGRGDESSSTRSYNEGGNREQFMMQHFGYRMRYNKLTEPEAGVDRNVMQRQFNTWLKQRGVLSSRLLDVPADYDRRFVLFESAIGNRIDDAFGWLSQNREKSAGHALLQDLVDSQVDYLTRRYLLEAIKASEAVPIVRAHLKMGRKVVVYHDYIKGGGTNPFALDLDGVDAKDRALVSAALAEFKAEFGDLERARLHELPSPLAVFRKAFADLLVVNGQEKRRDQLAAYKTFNDDATGPRVMLVQSAKDKGWSGHDTTGKHQRVLLNLGLPTSPTKSIQQEGRIYRTGNVSDAILRYLNTGTSWERTAFATTIASRAATAENLALGELARSLQDSYVQAFEESDTYEPGHDGEGKGGKDQDRARNAVISEWDRARTLYFAQQKKTAKTKSKEGADYFATPEPLGLKMAQWAGAREGEATLEPSAGHGAIARWLPTNARRTMVEPSPVLRSRLALADVRDTDRIVADTFENLAAVNKFDAIAMNPPFGAAGRTAVDHLAKAYGHLREGGRVVAILPAGPSADKKLEAWLDERVEKAGKDGEQALTKPELHRAADILLPASTFSRAAAGVMTRVIVLDKVEKGQTPAAHKAIDLRNAESVAELFDRLEKIEVPARPGAKAADAAPRQVVDRPAGASTGEPGSMVGQLEREDRPIVEHVTGKGKTIRGVVLVGVSRETAMLYDAYTFKKDGGWFVRERALAPEAKFAGADDVSGNNGAPEWAAKARPTETELANIRALETAIAKRTGMPRPGKGSRPVWLAAGELREAAALGAAADAFGSRVQWVVRGPRFGELGFDFLGANFGGVNYLRADKADRPHLAILGHEVLHQLRADNPDLYDEFAGAVQAHMLPGGFERFKQTGVARTARTDDGKLEEFMAEVSSDAWLRPEFWQDIGKKNPTLLGRLVDLVGALVEKVRAALSAAGTPPRTAEYLRDFDRVMEIATDVMGRYLASRLPAAGEVKFAAVDNGEKPTATAKRVHDTLRTMGWYDRTLSTQYNKALKNPYFGRTFDLASTMQNHVSLASLRPAELAPGVLPRVDDVKSAARTLLAGRKNVEPLAKASRAVFAGTLDGGANPLAGKVWSDGELRTGFGLDDTGIALYRQARRAIDTSLHELAAAEAWSLAQGFVPPELREQLIDQPQLARGVLVGEIDKQIAMMDRAIRRAEKAGDEQQAEELKGARAGHTDARNKIDKVFDMAEELAAAGYAPLMRFGKYTVTVVEIDPATGAVQRDEDGNPFTLYHGQFETEAEAKAMRDQLRLRHKGQAVRVRAGTKSQSAHELYTGITPETLALFAEAVGLDAATNAFYKEALSERSALKRRLERKGTAGYTQDLPRVLANFITSNARQAAQRYYLRDLNDSIKKIPNERGDVKDEAIALKKFMIDPSDRGGNLSTVMFAWYLGGNVASALVNMSQPVMMTAPYLAQFGAAKAAKALAKAIPIAMGKKQLDADLRAAMKRAGQEGIVDAQEVFHLYSIGAQGVAAGLVNTLARIPGVGDKVKASSESMRARAGAFLTLWGSMFALAEGFNRRLTFAAAWELAKTTGQADPYAFAVRAVNETQGIYNKVNRPNWGRSQLGRVLLTFKQYSLMYLELVNRMVRHGGPEGRRAALTMLAVLVLASGAEGLPFAQDLDDMIDTIGQALGFATNMRRDKRALAQRILGRELGDVALYGVSGGLPFDFAGRLGLGNLIPGTAMLKPSAEDGRVREITEVLGPAAGLVTQVADAYDAVVDGGGTGKALAALAPTAVRNAAAGLEMAMTGKASDYRGRKVTDAGLGDAVSKTVGFNPTAVANVHRRTMPAQQDVALHRRTEASILDQWARGIATADDAAVKTAQERLEKWNERNPELPIAVGPQQIRSRLRAMATDKDTRVMKAAPREIRQRVLAEDGE